MSFEDVLARIDAPQVPGKRGPYKKRQAAYCSPLSRGEANMRSLAEIWDYGAPAAGSFIALYLLWQIARLLSEAIRQLRLIKWWLARAQGESVDSNF